jgi:predicted ATPase/DNA-binding SARP family transcriptional activator
VLVALLGPLQVEAMGGLRLEIGGARLRTLFGLLALHAGQPVPDDVLVDVLWGDVPPTDVKNTVQSLVSRLRTVLRPASGHVLRSAGAGYVLALEPENVDVHRFEALAKQGHQDLTAGRFDEASTKLGTALGLWRGPVLPDFVDVPAAQAWIARLTELRADVLEDRFEAEMHLGRHAEVITDLETASAEHPLRERLASLRMQALHVVGRRSEALAVFDKVRTTLADELGVDPSAELRDAHVAALRGERPAPASTLPAQLTTFVGREGELRLLATLLTKSRLVTLVGPGGAGKSRLALEAASRCERVWFVPLAAVQQATDVVDAVLASLGLTGLRLVGSVNALPQNVDKVVRIADALGADQSVLLLDNCEHVLGAASQLAHQLLARVPRLRILATSREPLTITGETLCPVGPLDVPAERASASEAAVTSAVRLFVDRARLAKPGFALTDVTADSVVEICRRLDGMPLALELAAARLRAMSAGQIAQRLDDRFRLLAAGSTTALPRHRTLHAAVEWSWDLLDETERTLARRLSVLPAGATLATVESVCSDDRLEPQDMLYVLSSLVEKSIVTAVTDEPRYGMLETIRVFAAERLAEAGETDTVTERFAWHCLRLAEQADPALRTRDQLPAIRVFNDEYDNMTAALRWALDHEASEVAYRLTLALLWYWMMRGLHVQAVAFAGQVLRFGRALPEYALAALSVFHGWAPKTLIDDCVRTDAPSRVPVLALALPIMAFTSQDRELTDRELTRSLAHPHPWCRAGALWLQAFVLDDRGDLPGALRARSEALERYQELGDLWGIAVCLASLADTRSTSGDHAGAIAAFEQGHTLAIELGATDDAHSQKLRLANEYLRAGSVDRAWQCVAESERTANAVGNKWWAAMAVFVAVDIARRSGDLARARAELERLVHLTAPAPFATDASIGEWIILLRAAIALSEGDRTVARTELANVVHTATARRDLPNAARSAEVLALLHMQEGEPAQAARTLGVVRAIRGVFDHGNAELCGLIESITDDIGASAYAESYQRGSELSKDEAIAVLRQALDLPPAPATGARTHVWWGELWANHRMP